MRRVAAVAASRSTCRQRRAFVNLFQIEEPDGGPADPNVPGAAIGIDAGGAHVEVAFSVGGNAVILRDREGFERILAAPSSKAEQSEWEALLESAKVRAERALARPVTHAVIVLAEMVERQVAERLYEAAETAGLAILRIVTRTELPVSENPVMAAAMLAEDLAPRPA
jgi:hypothetical protein